MFNPSGKRGFDATRQESTVDLRRSPQEAMGYEQAAEGMISGMGLTERGAGYLRDYVGRTYPGGLGAFAVEVRQNPEKAEEYLWWSVDFNKDKWGDVMALSDEDKYVYQPSGEDVYSGGPKRQRLSTSYEDRR